MGLLLLLMDIDGGIGRPGGRERAFMRRDSDNYSTGLQGAPKILQHSLLIESNCYTLLLLAKQRTSVECSFTSFRLISFPSLNVTT